jgi:hypothetical protein
VIAGLTPRLLVAVAIGAAAGYGWHRLVGCRTGTCPITASPWISTIYGAFVGWLAVAGR